MRPDFIDTVFPKVFNGTILGFVLGIVGCTCGGSLTVGFVVLVICFVLSIIIGVFSYIGEKEEFEEKEREKEEEQHRRERNAELNRAYNNWYRGLSNSLTKIRDNLENGNRDFDYAKEFAMAQSYYRNYPTIRNSIGVHLELDSETKQYYDRKYHEAINWLIDQVDGIINENMINNPSPHRFNDGVMALKVMKIIKNNDEKFDKVIEAMSLFGEDVWITKVFIYEDGYGEIKFFKALDLEDSENWEYMEKNVDSIMNSIKDRYTRARGNVNDYYSSMVKCLDVSLLVDVGSVLWYYAKKKPFEIEKFNEAKALYNKYLTFYGKDEDEYSNNKVEVLLAEMYYKKQIGGESLVRKDWNYIEKWLENLYELNYIESCCFLASGLAWLELYNLEKDVLVKLVGLGCDLSEEMQDRLNFLENGGTGNVNIHDVPDNKEDVFYFDSSSAEWGQKEFEIFFRKVAMKKIDLQYSLSISNWTKTLPLSKGQKVSFENVYKELEDMVEDFDGEIELMKMPARAVNIDSIIYENAVIFKFNSVRNKCISVMFSCEKYGRNLNLTIITMFTPEEGLDTSDMNKYAVSVKSNSYMESFRESILQALDLALKEKQEVYDSSTENNADGNVYGGGIENNADRNIYGEGTENNANRNIYGEGTENNANKNIYGENTEKKSGINIYE